MRAFSCLCLLACACAVDPVAVEAPSGSVAARVVDAPSMTETEGDPYWELDRVLAGGQRLVQDARGVTLDGRLLAAEPLGPVALDARGARFVVAERIDGGPESRLLACAPPAPCRVVIDEGSPDRAAIAADGQRVAWVAAAGGLPAVFVAPFGGGPAVQVTNVGLSRTGGGPPLGFVEPPHHEPPRFEQGGLTWDAPSGPVRVDLP